MIDLKGNKFKVFTLFINREIIKKPDTECNQDDDRYNMARGGI